MRRDRPVAIAYGATQELGTTGAMPMTALRPLIAGNWKMNGLELSLDEARAVAAAVDARPPAARVSV